MNTEHGALPEDRNGADRHRTTERGAHSRQVGIRDSIVITNCQYVVHTVTHTHIRKEYVRLKTSHNQRSEARSCRPSGLMILVFLNFWF